jgi:fumarate reductase flavoprotein subunit
MSDDPQDSPAIIDCDVLVIGAGAAGLIAALRAKENGAEVIVIERDAIPRGSTALSAGLIPAAGTRFQKIAGINDNPALFAADILAKSEGEADRASVHALTTVVGPAIEWLADTHGLPFSIIENFSYPGHSARRMHGLPTRSGVELMDALRSAAERAGIDIVTNARARALACTADQRVMQVQIERPNGAQDAIGCRCLILACNGYGGNKEMVATYIPELKDALYFGHAGNRGDAILWGAQLGAATRHLSGHQGHGSVAHPHGILITWATMTEGGFQVNLAGERFSNEARGYSEQAAYVLRQPEGLAWSIFDTRIGSIARQFEDYRNAEAQGALVVANTIGDLANRTGLPVPQIHATFEEVRRLRANSETDQFGRSWNETQELAPPYIAVRVTGALFHTQGGLVVDAEGRVLDSLGQPLKNVFAAGGAACGVSGSKASGYLSGNGLLAAVGYGFSAGRAAARQALSALPA